MEAQAHRAIDDDCLLGVFAHLGIQRDDEHLSPRSWCPTSKPICVSPRVMNTSARNSRRHIDHGGAHPDMMPRAIEAGSYRAKRRAICRRQQLVTRSFCGYSLIDDMSVANATTGYIAAGDRLDASISYLRSIGWRSMVAKGRDDGDATALSD